MTNDVAANLSTHDGFDVVDESDPRLIQGSIIKFALEGRWTLDGAPWPDTTLLGMDCCKVIQRWQNQKPIEIIADYPLPDVEELNKTIPAKDWEIGLDGQPRPPYQLNYITYILDPASAARYTIVGATVGMKIAYSRLVDSVQLMRRLRGNHVSPLIKLGAAPMKTRFGVKQRPDFQVIGWQQLGGELLPADGGLKAISAPNAAEIIDDEIPF